MRESEGDFNNSRKKENSKEIVKDLEDLARMHLNSHIRYVIHPKFLELNHVETKLVEL